MYDSMLLRLRLAKTVGTDLLAVVQSVTVDGGFAPLALAQVQSSAHRAGGADVHAGDESGVGITVTAGTPTSEVVPSIPSRSDARSPFSSRPGSAAPSASTSAHNSAAPSASASARTSFDHPRPEPSRLSSRLPAPGPANNTHAHSHASSRPYGTTGGLAEASLQEVLASACDLANLRASKILGVRGEQHAGLKIGEFVQVYRANWAFVEETEGLGGRVVPSLRGVIAAQVC